MIRYSLIQLAVIATLLAAAVWLLLSWPTDAAPLPLLPEQHAHLTCA